MLEVFLVDRRVDYHRSEWSCKRVAQLTGNHLLDLLVTDTEVRKLDFSVASVFYNE